MKNFPSLQLLAAGTTAAQPTRIACDLKNNDATGNPGILFRQYPADRISDDATGGYTMPGITRMADPMGNGAATGGKTFLSRHMAADPAMARTDAGRRHIFTAGTGRWAVVAAWNGAGWPPALQMTSFPVGSGNAMDRNGRPALRSSAAWGAPLAWRSSTAFGTAVLLNRSLAAWGSAAAKTGGAQGVLIAWEAHRIPLRSPPEHWSTAGIGAYAFTRFADLTVPLSS